MSSETKSNDRLIETKLALAKKYQHLAMLTKSSPRRRNWLNKSESYRRQASRIGK